MKKLMITLVALGFCSLLHAQQFSGSKLSEAEKERIRTENALQHQQAAPQPANERRERVQRKPHNSAATSHKAPESGSVKSKKAEIDESRVDMVEHYRSFSPVQIARFIEELEQRIASEELSEANRKAAQMRLDALREVAKENNNQPASAR